MNYVYAHDKPTVRLLWLSNDTVNNVTPAMPWGTRDMEKVQYVPTLAPSDPVLVSGLVKSLKDAGPNSYLMINRSQVVYLQMDVGYSATWESRLVRNLDDRQDLKKVLVNDDVTMYALRQQPAASAAARPGADGPPGHLDTVVGRRRAGGGGARHHAGGAGGRTGRGAGQCAAVAVAAEQLLVLAAAAGGAAGLARTAVPDHE